MAHLLDLGVGSLIGVSCVMVCLPLYRSFSNRPVLDRWSYAFTLFAAFIAAVWLILLVRFVRAWRARQQRVGTRAARMLELAIAVWGLAYLISALSLPINAARALDFDVFGSVVPVSAF